MSHELRTPLTNIRSYAETLTENPDLPPDMMSSFLGVILNESDRMTHIVQDLLTLSRFDSGYSQMSLTSFPFGDVLRDSYQAVLLEAQRHGHELKLLGDADLPVIRADRERVLQVIMNIKTLSYGNLGIAECGVHILAVQTLLVQIPVVAQE